MKSEKTEFPIISEEIKKFLATSQGRKYFKEITPNDTTASRSEFKKSFLNPPANVRKHATVKALLENKINELNIKKNLDIW
jgi:hypothetical protein